MADYTPNYNLEKPTQDDNYDVSGFIGENMDKIDAALADKASKIYFLYGTLFADASAWGTDTINGQQVPIQVVEITDLPGGGSGPVSVGGRKLTPAEKEAESDGMLDVWEQAEGSVTIVCYGDKPTIDLPIMVKVEG